ncbi:glycosyltransferase family 4 protein [Spirulina subsalsa]|uniref:glycosyltransferase family 4 protein n=1 Tax=Spirulina subsalsa TaxID=54311 RepID=UPI000313B870|nr:glycosyltransferase family 4 protein [Spirulina subsalsa]
MRILVLSWEFPPRIVGGIARHVAELYPELVKLGHDIHLITVEFGDAPRFELVEGIKVHRIPVAPGNDFFHWVVNMNESMGVYGGKLIQDLGRFELIHAHDWLVGDAAIALKHRFKVPLVATIHATEHGRYNGIHNETHHYIHGKEYILAHNAWRIIVCTHYMEQEIQRIFHSPRDKINVIYNGIRPEKKRRDPRFDHMRFRRQFAADQEKIVYYLGRMSHEKGISVLLDAAPLLLGALGDRIKFVIIGGGNTSHLQHQAKTLGIWEKCYFTGFMSDSDLDKFQTIADCAVFPSLYEPFGIVALESFAARVPVVVSDTCGLPEVVQHGHTGIVTQTNNPHSLCQGILQILRNPDYARELVDNAYNDLFLRFDWTMLAQQTETVYQSVVTERAQIHWS